MGAAGGPWTREASRLLPTLRRWREAFHREPELSNQETRTRAKIVRALEELGLEPRTFDGFTGVLATIASDRSGPCVALRADMDALPIQEATRLPYRSREAGRMHACGHDVHMTCLLGAAAVLRRKRRALRGPVKLLFQPAEEEGEAGGARPFLELKAFESPHVDFVVGQHVDPELPVGTLGWRKGPIYAAADRFAIRVTGRGSHAAYPHLGLDPVVAASEVVLGLQALVSRLRDPVDPVVVSVGMIHGGTRHNVLPDEVSLEGTVRTLDPRTRDEMERLVKQRARLIAKSLGARATITYKRGYPPTVNPPAATELVVEALSEEFGESNVREIDQPAMGAEDFSRYLERAPGTFFKLGVGTTGGARSLHTSRFAPPDAVLPIGVAALAAAATGLQRGSR